MDMAFFLGTAGSNNDINVFNQTMLSSEQLKWQAPQMKYLVNEKEYQHDYYLVDRDIP
jgi:hypothetical protein